jgi:hypothetical protein
VTSDDTTGQTGVSRTWKVRRRQYDADRSIRTMRAYFIEARRALPLHQQAGYTTAILSLSRQPRGLANWEETIYGLQSDTRAGDVGLKPDPRT